MPFELSEYQNHILLKYIEALNAYGLNVKRSNNKGTLTIETVHHQARAISMLSTILGEAISSINVTVLEDFTRLTVGVWNIALETEYDAVCEMLYWGEQWEGKALTNRKLIGKLPPYIPADTKFNQGDPYQYSLVGYWAFEI